MAAIGGVPDGWRFCALRLAQRLLDPVPAGNCKLQTLRQYYRLAERGAHTALGDVMTVADLFKQVLKPIAVRRGLDTWNAVKAYAEGEWYPTRIAFCKHKGKSIQEARKNAELRKWLEWLASSSNARSASMGNWYLRKLEKDPPTAEDELFVTTEGDEEAGRVQREYQEADERTQREHETVGAAMGSTRQLSEAEQSELKGLWRELVKLFHPDRFADEPEKLEAYTKLTAAINAAKDCGDLETLRFIANDPASYMLRQGWAAIDLRDSDELEQLQKLYTSLEAEILTVIEATGALRDSPDYELYQLTAREPQLLDRVIQQQIAGIETELASLKAEAERLKHEIEELNGAHGPSFEK